MAEAAVRAFVLFRDSPERREALRSAPGAPERYRLYGLDQLVARGVAAGHNLERPAPFWARELDPLVNRAVGRIGGYGGDFAGVLGALRQANRPT